MLEAQQLGLAAISYDPPEVLRTFAERRGIRFPLLSDPESKLIRAFQVLNESVPAGNMAFGVPHPVTFFVDRNGVIVSKTGEADYKERSTVSNLLIERFDARTGAAETRLATKHLTVRATASNGLVRAGERIRLLLDIELKPRMHVYAPQVQGYIPIAWKLTESPAWRMHPVTFPEAKILHLKAIGEKVPVYERRFTLQREVTLGQTGPLTAAASNGELTIAGELLYQACDDRVCYLPQTLPITWKMKLEAADRIRAKK